ncbi:hypothetical protein INT45_007136 [Circinella minor]|uniref:B30.2/SPRY domain-containing protein n=1 Tax=Circinella minor TaxID=1195481 RepID=A0A8H7S3Y5_9FUNG|nr:hypothetical protein INT45_007136 [Circinella minor]
MGINYDGFYAVIVICIVLIGAIICCVGLRMFRRKARQNTRDEPMPSNNINEEWQALRETTAASPEYRQELEQVIAWQTRNPPRSTEWFDVTTAPVVRERGVGAWTFIENERMTDTDDDSNAAVMDNTTIIFCQGQGCVMTNLPIPMNQEFVYWEVKILQLGEQDRVAIGLGTKPYPCWRLPGWHRHSVAYHSHTGAVHASDPLVGRPYGPPYKEGDVIGVGYLSNSNTVFFTRNGKNLGKASIGFKFPVFPVVGAIGPAQVSVNFGEDDYLFAPANLREAALAPKQGTLPPPPAYGDLRNTIMLFGATDDDNTAESRHLDYSHQPQASFDPVFSPPPRYT